jgi:hypothetical protein
VLSSLAFAITLQDILHKVKQAFPSVNIRCILDDTNFQAERSQVFGAFDMFKRLIEEEGMQLNKGKSAVIVCGPEATAELKQECEQRGLPSPTAACKTLGTIIGDDDLALLALLKKEVNEAIEQMDKLHHPELSRQNAYKLLAGSIHYKLQYLARVVRPDLAKEELKRFDEHIITTACRILGITDKERGTTQDSQGRTIDLTEEDKRRAEHIKHQLQLPTAQGGFGLRPYSDHISNVAYLASVAAAADNIQQIWKDPLSAGAVAQDELRRSKMFQAIGKAVGKHAQEHANQKPLSETDTKWLPDDRSTLAFLHHATNLAKKTHNMQEGLTEQLDVSKLAQHFNELAGSQADMSRTLAAQAPEASRWLHTSPQSYMLRLFDDSFCTAARIRLGLQPFTVDKMPKLCACGDHVLLFDHPEHLLSCNEVNKKGFYAAHDAVKDCLMVLARKCGMPVMREVWFEEFKERMDLVIFTKAGEILLVDTSGTMPTAPYLVEHTSKKSMEAARRREQEKHRKYDALAAAYDAKLIPFIFERFGGINEAGLELLSKMNAHFKETRAEHEEEDISSFLHCAVAKAIQHGNFLMVSSAVSQNKKGKIGKASSIRR